VKITLITVLSTGGLLSSDFSLNMSDLFKVKKKMLQFVDYDYIKDDYRAHFLPEINELQIKKNFKKININNKIL